MASDRVNKRHTSVKRPRETASNHLSDASYTSPHPSSSSSSSARAHHPSSRAGRSLSLSSPGSSSSSHSAHPRGRMKGEAEQFRTPTRNRPALASPSTADPNAALLECARCSHLFPSHQRLHAHNARKHRCHPNDHLRSPPSSGQSSPTAASASSLASPTTRRWYRHSRTGLPRFNADAFTLSVRSASAESIRLSVGRRGREERLDPGRLSSEYVCHANEAIVFKLVRSESDLLHEFGSFRPSFTHQLFPDEDVVGYKKLYVECAFTAGSLYAHIHVHFDEKVKHGSDDVFGQIAGKMPHDAYTTDIHDFKQHIGEEFTPPGEKVLEYIVPSVDSSKDAITYEVYQGSFSDGAVRAYHSRLQFFLLFFIDRSSFINDADPLWEILLLMERRVARHSSAVSYAVVGYTTLYKFLSYPSSWRLRLSQILILPPFQRCGHGARLLQFVYEEAARRQFAEVNIEDPAPAFQFLRDLTDVQNARRRGLYQKQPGEMVEGPGGLCAAWDRRYAESVQAALRIPMRQVRRCYEIFKLAQTDVRQSRQYELYRQEVKRRLYCEREEQLCTSAKGMERKELLHRWYMELEQHYLQVIKKARIH